MRAYTAGYRISVGSTKAMTEKVCDNVSKVSESFLKSRSAVAQMLH